MLGKVLTSPKLLSANDYLHFPDEECENTAKSELDARRFLSKQQQ